ncbi:V/A-type H+-transporting ATPase subunit I [Streptomyces sp. SceaMP-e96]|uniref:V-type ATPase 116kDa subunit family protein n=1 Tax=unclassified Streptomyces TaxID=2593676 RepID=UPI000823E2B1|nr:MULTISPECIES: V-type ATPase 116kDa subunit family protein [unclassified Streptomyces]MYT15698.1 ATPase [Streptomyces sp. SID4951]SCK23939.1 V/A-type H+-transporting ATPase subunit I [Streptomyces sp. SceaMP-e96]
MQAVVPVRIQRVAIVAPREALRETLVRIAEAGCVEIDRIDDVGSGEPDSATRRLRRARGEPEGVVLSALPPDLDALERAGRTDLLAGEAQLEERLAGTVRRGAVAALAGWCPAAEVPATAERIAGAGGALVPLRTPRGIDPPTLLRSTGAVHRSFTPLVRTYGTVPYADLDPTLPAGIVYVAMFGVMFGDAGHGALLLLAGLLLCLGRPRRLTRLRPLWPFIAGAGLASTLAGVAYGEFFGPTGVLPVLWLNPLDKPIPLLAGAVGLGAVLLALAYGAGTVNRWRDNGAASALYAASGIAGAALFLGLALTVGSVFLGSTGFALAGAAITLTGLVLAGYGLYATTAGGPGGVAQTGVQLFDVVVRLGSNVISFTRLAAFGLTHAALGSIVWNGTTGLARTGAVALPAAVLVFVIGNALAFALEALVAGVQALRLEFYELFSRVFESQGRPFRPWHLPVQHTEVAQ